MIFYNLYNLSSIILLSDIFWITVAVRIAVMTPVTLLVVRLLGHMTAQGREWLVLACLASAGLPSLTFFWATQSPYGAYTFSEIVLLLVFGNMTVALRFRHALAFTCLILAFAVAALATKAGLDTGLRIALFLQLATGCVISLSANHQGESRRCRDYLATLEAQLTSVAAEAERKHYLDLSHIDMLTGLPNRRALAVFTEREFRVDRSAAVLMIDIDHFKLFNDTLGHPAGDACLREVANLFAAASTPPASLFARFGGEEFMLVMADTDPLAAARIAGQLVRDVAALGIPHPGLSDGWGVVTISVGVAFAPAGLAPMPEAVIKSADQALYRAKCQGRNRFVLDDEVGLGHARARPHLRKGRGREAGGAADRSACGERAIDAGA